MHTFYDHAKEILSGTSSGHEKEILKEKWNETDACASCLGRHNHGFF
jgi:hypothetical protein